MGQLELRPLVIVRRHSEGLVSACAAFAPQWPAYADDADGAVAELVDFLSDYFLELPADELQKFVVPEEATVQRVAVTLTRDDLPRAERVRTPVELPVVVVSGSGGCKWVMLPTLGQVSFVPEARVQALDETLREEVGRLVAASDLDGVAYLDHLPCSSFELLRPAVPIELDRSALPSGKQAAKLRALREAERLLEQVARKVSAPTYPVVERDLRDLSSLLAASQPESLVLVGAEGVGKSAWLRAAAAEANRPCFATSGAELVAGQSGLGQLEERVEAVVEAVKLLDGVLYFENLEDLFAGRTGGYEDIASLLRRPLERGGLRLIAETTQEGYDRLSQRHVGFFSYLRRVNVPALDRQQTLRVLAERSRVRVTRRQRGVDAEGRARLLALVERYEPYRVLPGKAVALFDELASLSSDSSSSEPRELSADDVLAGFATKSGIPAFLLRDERALEVEYVEKFLRAHVVGQEHAVRRVAQTLCSVKAGLQPVGKPLATLLFLGPTGVGKTELSKALARFLFGSAERMARFDMSEYTDLYAADRLIRGTERSDGVLTRRVREQPFGVVLLDEIEKAHPSVFDLLLQVAGEGRLSDGRGKVAHFDNTIIILTSNLGAQHRRARVGFGDGADEDDASYYLAQVERHFRPEVVGRLDGIVAFSSLRSAEIRQVARLSVERIARRTGLEGRELRLVVSERALDVLAEAGFSPSYGARGLRRFLEQALVAPLASLVSALGDEAVGAVILVQALVEAELEPALGSLVAEHHAASLPPLVAGRISIGAMLPPRRQREAASSGVGAISRLRRAVRRWHALPVLDEARARRSELTVQLAQAKHHRTPGATLVELSREHARLSALLSPLDEALSGLEDIEGLLIAALDEAPPDLGPEATQLHERYQAHLLEALFERSEEDTLCFALHELDDRKLLHVCLLPLLRFAIARGWGVLLHFDRGERVGVAWPPVAERRWGPPIAGSKYLQELPEERPADAVLLRVRGAGAGALLSFYLGRLRYEGEGDEKAGEIWMRPLTRRFLLRDEDWQAPQLSPVIDRGVGRKQRLSFWVTPGEAPPPGTKGPYHKDIGPEQLFEAYAKLVFTRALTQAFAGKAFVPALGRDE